MPEQRPGGPEEDRAALLAAMFEEDEARGFVPKSGKGEPSTPPAGPGSPSSQDDQEPEPGTPSDGAE